MYTYHVLQFLPYNIQYFVAFLDPLPTLKLDAFMDILFK